MPDVTHVIDSTLINYGQYNVFCKHPHSQYPDIHYLQVLFTAFIIQTKTVSTVQFPSFYQQDTDPQKACVEHLGRVSPSALSLTDNEQLSIPFGRFSAPRIFLPTVKCWIHIKFKHNWKAIPLSGSPHLLKFGCKTTSTIFRIWFEVAFVYHICKNLWLTEGTY